MNSDQYDVSREASIPLPPDVKTLTEKLSTLTQNLSVLVNNWNLCDVILAVEIPRGVAVESKDKTITINNDQVYSLVPAVRSVLAARSPVFQALLFNNFQEGAAVAGLLTSYYHTNVAYFHTQYDQPCTSFSNLVTPRPIVVVDLGLHATAVPAFKSLVEFCSTGVTTQESESINALLALHGLAELFQVPSLTEICQDSISSFLTPQSACDILCNPLCCNNIPLKLMCLEYIDGHGVEVMQSAAFKLLPLDVIITIISRTTLRISNESTIFMAVLEWAKQQVKLGRVEAHDVSEDKIYRIAEVSYDEQEHSSLLIQDMNDSNNNSNSNSNTEMYVYDDDQHKDGAMQLIDASRTAVEYRRFQGESQNGYKYIERYEVKYVPTMVLSSHSSVSGSVIGDIVKLPADDIISGNNVVSSDDNRIVNMTPNNHTASRKRGRSSKNKIEETVSSSSTSSSPSSVIVLPAAKRTPVLPVVTVTHREFSDVIGESTILRCLFRQLLRYIRMPLIESDTLAHVIEPMNIVDPKIIIHSLAYHAQPNISLTLPKHQYEVRSWMFRFNPQEAVEGEWEVSSDGRSFQNVLVTEASITVAECITRKENDTRRLRFEAKLEELPSSNGHKGFFGVGVLDHPLLHYKEGVTSKQHGTLYYSNGWISSFGTTLDKTGNVPPFDVEDTIGFEVNFATDSIQFILNGNPSGPIVALHNKFLSVGAKLYPVVRLKGRSKTSLIS